MDFINVVTLKDTFDGENYSLALLALENLLNLCLTADRIKNKEVQWIFYRKVVKMLFDNANPIISAWYRCLKALLSLNHLIIEPDVDELLSAGWINSDCTEPLVRKAHEALISSVLLTYAS